MTVTSVGKDPEALNMTIITELDATVERAWQLWADLRQLDRWAGNPNDGMPTTTSVVTLTERHGGGGDGRRAGPDHRHPGRGRHNPQVR